MTELSGTPINLATRDLTRLSNDVAQLIATKDETQLQILRAALKVQIKEHEQTKAETQGLKDLISTIGAAIEPVQDPAPSATAADPPPLTADAIQRLFTTRLREGVPLIMASHRLGTAEAILNQAIGPARAAYDDLCSASPYADLLPKIDAITSGQQIAEVATDLEKDSRILSTDVATHVKERPELANNPTAEEEYRREQHASARRKVATSWAKVARAYFVVHSQLETLSDVQKVTDQEDAGRDAAGRFAYLLMSTAADDLF